MGEDELIQTIFAPLAADFPGALGLRDDAAFLVPPSGSDLVLTMDAVAEGVHFFPDDAAADIAWKAIAVNVSDLIAKGARPLTYLMSVSFPELPSRDWLDGFGRGLAEGQAAFGLALAGGDTDRRPGPLTVAVTAIGAVAKGTMVRRASGRPGDFLYLSGTVGDSALGLLLRGSRMSMAEMGLDDGAAAALVSRYLRPGPRLAMAPLVATYATAAMDVSDGLVKDCGRLAGASGLAAEIDGRCVPLSGPARAAIAARADLFEAAVTGGDDYEVLAAVAPARAADFEAAAAAAGVPVTRIGRLCQGAGVAISRPDGAPLMVNGGGWNHFPG